MKNVERQGRRLNLMLRDVVARRLDRLLEKTEAPNVTTIIGNALKFYEDSLDHQNKHGDNKVIFRSSGGDETIRVG